MILGSTFTSKWKAAHGKAWHGAAQNRTLQVPDSGNQWVSSTWQVQSYVPGNPASRKSHHKCTVCQGPYIVKADAQQFFLPVLKQLKVKSVYTRGKNPVLWSLS